MDDRLPTRAVAVAVAVAVTIAFPAAALAPTLTAGTDGMQMHEMRPDHPCVYGRIVRTCSCWLQRKCYASWVHWRGCVLHRLRHGLYLRSCRRHVHSVSLAAVASHAVHSNPQHEPIDHRSRRGYHVHMELQRPPADARRDLPHRWLRTQ